MNQSLAHCPNFGDHRQYQFIALRIIFRFSSMQFQARSLSWELFISTNFKAFDKLFGDYDSPRSAYAYLFGHVSLSTTSAIFV